MVRRFGTLGLGALLSLVLAPGCVVVGNPADEVRTETPAAKQTPPRSPNKEGVFVPFVTAPMQRDRIASTEPSPPAPPPPPLEIQTVQVSVPSESFPLGTSAHVLKLPADGNPPSDLTAMLTAVRKHPAEFAEALQKYDKPTQEMLQAIILFAARVSEGDIAKASAQERAALVAQLDQATAALRSKTPLTIEKMCYCRRISNYGIYDPLPDDHAFTGGRNHSELVQLYVEARNFTNRQDGKFYDTALGSKLEIHSKGELVARMDFPAQPDRSLSPRQDYFIHYQFYVPARMEPGEYTLTISLQDNNATGEGGPRPVKRSLPFHVGGPVAAHTGQ